MPFKYIVQIIQQHLAQKPVIIAEGQDFHKISQDSTVQAKLFLPFQENQKGSLFSDFAVESKRLIKRARWIRLRAI